MSVNLQRALENIRNWNKAFSVGTVVEHNGERRKTWSPAGLGPRNEPSVWLEGVEELVSMARDVKKRNPAIVRLVSYQDTEVHTGAIYRAAGWEATAITEGATGNHHQWSNKGRARAKGQSDAAKQRWEQHL